MPRATRIRAAVAAASAIALVLVFASRRASQATDELPLPLAWIPFSADFALIHAGLTHPPSYGRYYRARDGSTRVDTWGAQDSSTIFVDIKNFSNGVSYRRTTKRGWTAAPMDVPSDGWPPPKVRVNTPGLTPYRYKLALAKGQDGSLTSTTGFNAYQFVTTAGNMWLVVPELNFLPVAKQWITTGRRELLTNIVLEDPDPALFFPPQDATVTAVQGPRGIVLRKALK